MSKPIATLDTDGKPIILPSGTYFCYNVNCNIKRKVIPSGCVGTIEPCRKCRESRVFKI